MRNAPEVYHEAFNLLCGDLIGGGIHRQVFECKLRPDLVVKVEDQDYRDFANVKEMQFWRDHSFVKKIAVWLAPCEHLSPDGRILIQKRVEKVTAAYKMPDKVPSFLTDLKKENFGWLDGKLVCIDYSTTIPNPSMILKKAHW